MTDTGPLIIASPDDPRNFLATCLGFESWCGDWEVSFDGDIIGFSSVNDQRPCLGDSLRAQGSWCSGSWSGPARGLSGGTLSNVDITEHQLSAGH